VQIARKGQTAPDGNGNFFQPVFAAYSLNDAGQVAVLATLTETSGDTNDNEAIYIFDDASGLAKVARKGDPLLGSTITALFFNGSAVNPFPGPTGDERSGLNEAGQVAYRFRLADGRDGIAIWSVHGLRGDYNGDHVVDAADYTVWRDTVGSPTDRRADGTGPGGVPDGVVDELDYQLWVDNFGMTLDNLGAASLAGNVPEPSTFTMLLLAAVGASLCRRRIR
jgi:hypothetical protein